MAKRYMLTLISEAAKLVLHLHCEVKVLDLTVSAITMWKKSAVECVMLKYDITDWFECGQYYLLAVSGITLCVDAQR